MINEDLPVSAPVVQGMYRLDAHGRLAFVDEPAARILGYAPQELIGRHFAAVFFAEDLPQAQRTFGQRRLGIGVVTDYSLRRKDGSAVWVAVASAPTLDEEGVFLGITGFITDIDARHRRETLSAHERRLLRMIAGNYPLATVLEDLCLTLEAVSRRPMRATVMLAAGDSLRCVAAPSLPPEFRSDRSATRLEGSGTACATAVRSRRKAIVADTARADISPDIAACRASYGFGAIWSYPIEYEAEILGTLALLLPTAGEPDAEDELAIEFAIQVVRLALARERDIRVRQEAEQRLRDFAELSADWFWEQDAEFRFTQVTQGSNSRPVSPPYYGQGSIGRQRWELPYVNVPEGFWDQHRRQLQAGQPFARLCLQWRNDNGELRHIEISGKPVFDGEGRLTGYRGTGRDITQQVAASDKLEKTRHWLEQAVRAASIGLWERDVDSWTFDFGGNWKAQFGYAEDEIGHAFEDFDSLVHPDDLARIRAFVRAYEKDPRGDYENRFRIRHKDGSWRWVLSRGRILTDAATGRRTWMGCHIDITEQWHNENRVRELAAMLETRVKARTAELEEANRELDAFNFSVAHDLRTPLRAIEGFSQALLEDHHERLDGAGRDYLQRIGAATARMGELIEALYGLTRLSRVPLTLRPVDLSAMAHELAAELHAQQPQRAVEFEIEDTPPVEGDPRLLRIVLANLLGNAWKFTARAAPARIGFGMQITGDGRAEYCVRDNGAGFDMQFADKLFLMFHRLHREHEFPGQGIGLATVQRILARHGGHIRGDGQPGAGASFCFTLWNDPALLAEARAAVDPGDA